MTVGGGENNPHRHTLDQGSLHEPNRSLIGLGAKLWLFFMDIAVSWVICGADASS